MTSFLRIVGAACLAALLTGCAYKSLKAPCAPDEDAAALSYAEPPQPTVPAAFLPFDSCGPMRPIEERR